MNRDKARELVLKMCPADLDRKTAHELAIDAVKLLEHSDVGEHVAARCLDLGGLVERDLAAATDAEQNFYAVGSWLALGRLVQRKVLRAQRREAAE